MLLIPVGRILWILVLGLLLKTSHQEGTARTWDSLSRLIPTNSVYEQRETRRAEDVLNTSRQETERNGGGEGEGGEEGPEDDAYDDEYEVETESRPTNDQNGHSKFVDEPANEEKLDETSNESRSKEYEEEEEEEGGGGGGEEEENNEEHLGGQKQHEDHSTNQYDDYYEDYDNSSRTQYESLGDTDVIDYPDAEAGFKESNDTSLLSSNSTVLESENSKEMDGLTEDEKIEVAALSSNSKDGSSGNGSSMEGSDKRFNFVGAPGHSGHPGHRGQNDSADSSILIGEAVVSVVTTKSVVNGTISVPPTTSSPLTTEQVAAPPSRSSPSSSSSLLAKEIEREVSSSSTTEDSIILASVQTSRSISGARFLPFPVIDRVEQVDHDSALESRRTSPPPESTESIIDKLDRVQSELSSGFLVGGFRTAGNTLQLDVLADRANRRKFTTTARTPLINKFVPRRYNDKRVDHSSATTERVESTTSKNSFLVNETKIGSTTTERSKVFAFRWPSKMTSSTEASTRVMTPTSRAATTTRKLKTNVIVEDINAFLPPGYKLKKEDSDVTEKSLLTDILAKSKVDISSLLPADYQKKKNEDTSRTMVGSTRHNGTGVEELKESKGLNEMEMTEMSEMTKITEKPELEKIAIQDLFAKSKFDISSLLPRDFLREQKQKEKDLPVESGPPKTETEAKAEAGSGTWTNTTTAPPSAWPATTKSGSLKIVFPSRPGGRKPSHKITTAQPPRGDGAGVVVTPRIQKGWPTRATTEFTGWPTPSTTPISIERLLEAARTATVASVNTSVIPTTSISSSTSTTSTTTTTPRPTTPGLCDEECEVAGTIRIIGNATWMPELLDRNTHEWQHLANELEKEMNFIFSKSAVLTNWFKSVRIDSFSQGSILVDYFVELVNIQQRVNTQELKVIFHDSLRTYNAQRWNDTRSKSSVRLGQFMIDPKFTDFVVIPKVTTPQYIEQDDKLIPQWAIAVIVIGVGGLLFIIVFGVSVLVNRQNRSKLKPSISTIYEEEVAKNMIGASHTSQSHRSTDYSKPIQHTIWTDPDVSWNDKSFESTSNKILVDRSYPENKKYNLYDSWRSEWNGYYSNPSHTSSKYGGFDSTTNLSSRHHPDYDTNF